VDVYGKKVIPHFNGRPQKGRVRTRPARRTTGRRTRSPRPQ
jgi:hypothetical protein